MCMMGSLDEEIKKPSAFYDPAKGGIFLAYEKRDRLSGESAALSTPHGEGQETVAGDKPRSVDRISPEHASWGEQEASTGSKPLGICCLEEHQPIHPDIRVAEIRRMYVCPEARGQKVGESLIMACVKEAVKLGYRRVVLDTFQEPTYALRLYKRLGFTECAPFNHLPLDKAVWLEKML